MKTFVQKKEQALLERKWYLIDAENKVLGKIAIKAANLLRGKTKATFTPHVDCGDFVVVINADKVKLTGKKETDKIYYRHTGHVGGIKKRTAKEMRVKHPERMIEIAVKGMIPHNKLGDHVYTKLKVYAGNEHPHTAQSPQTIEL